MALIPELITVTVPGVVDPDDVDEMGNPVEVAPVVSEVLVKAFAPRDSSDSAEEYGGVAITGGVVYGYRGTSIPHGAVLTIRGIDFLIDGEVGDLRPTYTSAIQLGAEGVQFSVKRAS